MLIAGIDQGTTSTKCLLVDRKGEAREVGAVRHQQILPQEGWVEHDARELLRNVEELVRSAVAHGAAAVALANQGETIVAWDRRSGEPLCNAIVWQDQRTLASVEALRTAGVEAEVKALSGLPLDPYFSASKFRWILDNVSAARRLAEGGHLGLATSDAYFLERLTGRYITDATTACRTSLMNLETCEWDARLGEIFDVPIELLPAISDWDAPCVEASIERKSIPVLASVVDQIAALYGHGCRSPGDAKITFGTGAFALVITGHAPCRELPAGVLPTLGWKSGERRIHAADGGVYTAGAAVEWLQRIGLLGDLSELERLAGVPAASGGVFFVPALAGLACPHWDRSAAGLWIGLDAATGQEDLVKAVLEGVAFRTAEVLEAFGPLLSARGVLSVDGGLTRSAYFLQFLADITGRAVSNAGERELTAIGAALLAQAAADGVDPGGVVDPEAHQTTMLPTKDAKIAREWNDRFAEARARSAGWRSPASSSRQN